MLVAVVFAGLISVPAIAQTSIVGAGSWNIENVDSVGDVGTWSSWGSLSGQLTASPGAVSWADGRIDTFVRGTNGALCQKTSDNSAWSGWTSLGGQIAANTSPAVSSWAEGRLDLFVSGTNDALYHKSYS